MLPYSSNTLDSSRSGNSDTPDPTIQLAVLVSNCPHYSTVQTSTRFQQSNYPTVYTTLRLPTLFNSSTIDMIQQSNYPTICTILQLSDSPTIQLSILFSDSTLFNGSTIHTIRQSNYPTVYTSLRLSTLFNSSNIDMIQQSNNPTVCIILPLSDNKTIEPSMLLSDYLHYSTVQLSTRFNSPTIRLSNNSTVHITRQSDNNDPYYSTVGLSMLFTLFNCPTTVYAISLSDSARLKNALAGRRGPTLNFQSGTGLPK
jgi:hypothetical protein